MNNERKANLDDDEHEEDDKREGRWMGYEGEKKKEKGEECGRISCLSIARQSFPEATHSINTLNSIHYMTQYEPSGIRGGRGDKRGARVAWMGASGPSVVSSTRSVAG